MTQPLVIMAEAMPDARVAAVQIDRVIDEAARQSSSAGWIAKALDVSEAVANAELEQTRGTVRTYIDEHATSATSVRFLDVHRLRQIFDALPGRVISAEAPSMARPVRAPQS